MFSWEYDYKLYSHILGQQWLWTYIVAHFSNEIQTIESHPDLKTNDMMTSLKVMSLGPIISANLNKPSTFEVFIAPCPDLHRSSGVPISMRNICHFSLIISSKIRELSIPAQHISSTYFFYYSWHQVWKCRAEFPKKKGCISGLSGEFLLNHSRPEQMS